MSHLFHEAYRVRFFDAEPGGRASVPAVCRFLEEAANSQTERLGLSLRQVREADRMWVLTRFALNVFALPRSGDEISVETWASDRTGGVRAYRDFRMRDAEGNVLAEAASLWLLLDLRTRRLVRLPDPVLRIREPERVGAETVDSRPLIAPETVTGEDEFKVRWSDLDENGHANNIRYIEWVLETIPVSVREAGLNSLDIQFVNEALPGETVLAVSEATADGFRHGLTAGDGRVLGIARTTWYHEARPSSSSGSPNSP
ncbi:MAG: acyl-ACP thioesterase domain-containing protein [Acidobacteriota bacterium]